ncbi:MAG: beta-ketoacyl synthase N-terminal-like domain-containing protein, partial [Chloroflexota bacterium]
MRDTKEKVHKILNETLYLDTQVDEEKPFSDLGMDSITGVEFVKRINQAFEIEMKASKLYDHPTVKELAAYIFTCIEEAGLTIDHQEATLIEASELDTPPHSVETVNPADPSTLAQETDVAIIGMSGRFPGAANIDAYWHNLKAGICSITEVPADRWRIDQFYDPRPQASAASYSKWGGFLTDIDKFDPLFFNISPAEARVMDPQQRLVLEEVYHALEHAGYAQQSAARQGCGLYVGIMGSNEYHTHILKKEDDIAQAMLGNAGSILAGRVAYAFDLQGPVITIDTACSSSLVAIDMAYKSLIHQETDLMIAGGVTLYLTEQPYIGMSKAQMLSPEGLCKAFDAGADGFVPGEGVGFVVLKRLNQAIADGDTIYGVIKGSGVNQDGKTNGLTAPNIKSQRDLQLAIYEQFNLDPKRISYVETHGTGTKLGDPIEFEALTEAFQTYTDRKQYCAIGSVKTNIGHTSAAAGVAGVIKVLLAMQHQLLPPSLHFNTPNGHIDFENSPFYVNTQLTEWPATAELRQAAVSSFGFSGTNAHLVLEAYPSKQLNRQKTEEAPQLIVLSAKDEAGLQQVTQRLLDYLETDNEISLRNLAYTLQVGRA